MLKYNKLLKKNYLNRIFTLSIVIILLFSLFIETESFNNNEKTQIKRDLNDIENILKDFLSDKSNLSLSIDKYLIEDIEMKISEKTIISLNGTIRHLDLNRNYYRIPGVILAIIDSEFRGEFIWDDNEVLYYID